MLAAARVFLFVFLLLFLGSIVLFRRPPSGIRAALWGDKAFMGRRYGASELDRAPGEDRAAKLAYLRENPDGAVSTESQGADSAWLFRVAYVAMLLCALALMLFSPLPFVGTMLFFALVIGGVVAGGWHLLNGR